MIIIPKLKIGYQQLPKNATTSMFEWFYGCLINIDSVSVTKKDAKKNRRRRHFLGDSDDAFIVSNTQEQVVDRFGNYYRFAITRDPVKRFVSMYSNRVVYHRKLSKWKQYAAKIEECGLMFDPEINFLVEKFQEYAELAGDIEHHARSMMSDLGPDLAVYQKLYDVSDVGHLIKDIVAFWEQNGMRRLASAAPELERKQTGGPKLGLEVLTEISFEKLLEIYRDDYENIPTVSLAKIKDEYVVARKWV